MGRIVFLAALAMATAFLVALPAHAQTVSIDIGGGEGASYTARLVQLFLLITVLSLAPSLLVMGTSFVRIIVVFSLLRSALGLQQSPPNVVLVSVALFLTAFVMGPTMETAWREGVEPMMSETVDQSEGIKRSIAPFREFMSAQVDDEDLAFFEDLAARQAAGTLKDGPLGALDAPAPPQADEIPLRVLVPAFMISELTRAFEIGFLVFMPFLVIDLAIAAILMSMGMMMLPPVTVSLPMKLIFFVLIDGWRLLSASLVQSFG